MVMKKFLWGLGIGLVLLVSVGGYYMYQQSTEEQAREAENDDDVTTSDLNEYTDDEDDSDDESDSSSESSESESTGSESESSDSESESSSTKPEETYKPIEQVFDMNTIMDQDDQTLLTKGIDVELDNYKVVDFGADQQRHYHVLLSPDGGLSPMFLLVFKRKTGTTLTLSDTVTAKGMINGTGTVNNSQTGSGIKAQYSGDKVILFIADSVTW
jgi:hypothetical protein